MDSISLKSVNPNDLSRLAVFVNSAYRGDSSRSGWTTEADLLDGQRTDAESLQSLLGPEQTILFAEDAGGEILGCVHLKKLEDSAYLGMLTVHPQKQDQGLGRQILSAAESFAQEKWKVRAIQMTVISLREELIAWYERRGYIRTGQTEKFPYGDERFGLPKREGLKFCVLKKILEE
jgi:ribosomal protein S18 acetylase RimI-like enzyme